jgi:adenine phosphoribosyltransferase
MRAAELKTTIREVPDFPKPGINFYDVTTLFRNPAAFKAAVDTMVERYRGEAIDAIAGIDARGFVLASVMAYQLELGLILVRKEGRLPADVEGESYALEYGTARLEIHRDAVKKGQRVLVVDDLLATGGSAAATAKILERLGATVAGFGFMIELKSLQGRKSLGSDDVFALLTYD